MRARARSTSDSSRSRLQAARSSSLRVGVRRQRCEGPGLRLSLRVRCARPDRRCRSSSRSRSAARSRHWSSCNGSASTSRTGSRTIYAMPTTRSARPTIWRWRPPSSSSRFVDASVFQSRSNVESVSIRKVERSRPPRGSRRGSELSSAGNSRSRHAVALAREDHARKRTTEELGPRDVSCASPHRRGGGAGTVYKHRCSPGIRQREFSTLRSGGRARCTAAEIVRRSEHDPDRRRS